MLPKIPNFLNFLLCIEEAYLNTCRKSTMNFFRELFSQKCSIRNWWSEIASETLWLFFKFSARQFFLVKFNCRTWSILKCSILHWFYKKLKCQAFKKLVALNLEHGSNFRKTWNAVHIAFQNKEYVSIFRENKLSSISILKNSTRLTCIQTLRTLFTDRKFTKY